MNRKYLKNKFIIGLMLIVNIFIFNSCYFVAQEAGRRAIEYAANNMTNNLIKESSGELKKEVNTEYYNEYYGRIISITLLDEEITKVLEYSNIPAKNCNGGNMIRLNETLTKSTTNEYSLAINPQIDIGIAQLISAGIEVQYEISKGQIIERSFSFEVDVKPNSYNIYEIMWTEIWRKGEAVFEKKNEEKIKVPFEIKSSIQYEIKSVREIGCSNQ